MAEPNPYIDLAIQSTQRLQKIILKMVEREKDIQDQVNSSDYVANKFDDFMKESTNDFTDETEILEMVQALLYRLMDYNRNVDRWHDDEDYQERTQVRLKGAIG